MSSFKKKVPGLLRFIPLLLCLVLMAAYLLCGQSVSADSLKGFAPSAPVLAVGFLLALYALKSLSVVFPIIALNILGGFLFSPFWAMVVNFVGVGVTLALPYWVGRLSGSDLVEKLETKYPKFGHFFHQQNNDLFFLSFFLRAIFCLPGDLVSMYFGAISMPFGKYMAGSFLGMIPGTVAATFLGISITDPGSALFWISIGSTVGVALICLAAYCLWKKAQSKKSTVVGRR